MPEAVKNLTEKLSEDTPQVISGRRNDRIEILEPADLIRIYANTGKIFAVTDKGEYTVRLRLYELEERLNPHQFVRISNSEIINLKKVEYFDLSFTGTICSTVKSGAAMAYISPTS